MHRPPPPRLGPSLITTKRMLLLALGSVFMAAGNAAQAAESSVTQAPCWAALKAEQQRLQILAADENTEAVKTSRQDLNLSAKSALKSHILLALGLEPSSNLKTLEEALKTFQKSNGLNPTGAADARTVHALLPWSTQYRKALLEQALLQCQVVQDKLQRDKPARFIEVNLASQQAVAYELNAQSQRYEPAVQTAVIVGKPTTKTPLSDFQIWAVKFNPGWTPTPNILKRSAFKADGLDRKWIESHNIQIRDKDGELVDPDFVNPYNYHDFRYFEPPSDKAALGALKLETTSDQDIYMHDTPEKNKFSWNVRLASSGCIRVQHIEPLAKWVFETHKDSERAQLFSKTLAKEKNVIKKTPSPVPVYLTYRLVQSQPGLPVQYLPDVYQRVAGLNPSVQTAQPSVQKQNGL